MSISKLTDLQHLRAVFDTAQRVQQLEQGLRIVAEHHTGLASHLRGQLADGVYDAPHSLITRRGAEQLAATHDALAADSTAMADTVRRALHPGFEEDR